MTTHPTIFARRLVRPAVLATFALSAAMLVGSASAQTVDAAALETVVTAFENTRAASSLHLVVNTTTEIAGLPAGMGIGDQSVQDVRVVRTEGGYNAAGTRTSTTQIPQQDALTLTTEFILLDGAAYVRTGELPEAMISQMATAVASGATGENVTIPEMPQGWVNASEMAAGSTEATAGTMDVATLTANLLGTLDFPVSAESVTALAELDGDTINGQSVRVFQLTLNAAAVADSDAAALLNVGGGLGGGFGGGMMGVPGADGQMGGQFPGGTPPAGFPQGTPPAELANAQPPNAEDAEITFAVYIGEQDGLIHRIYSVVVVSPTASAEGQPDFSITSTSVSDFSEFNIPVEITAPTLGS